MKSVVDIVIFEIGSDVIKDTIHCVDALRFDDEHNDLVINSYGLISYLKHPEKWLLKLEVREIKDEL